MARKGWDALSPDYRKRLQRGGITKSRYESGAKLHKARGKKSAEHESRQRKFWRAVDRTGTDRETAKEVIDEIGFDEADEILMFREMALNPIDETDKRLGSGAMRNLYGQYEGIVPKEWLYYHS